MTTMRIAGLAGKASTVSFLLTGGLLSCGAHGTKVTQAVRTCADRWNQSEMMTWGPAPANVAFRRPLAKERESIYKLSSRRRCIIAIAAGGGTWTCLLAGTGAYACVVRHEASGPPLKALGGANARIDKVGVLRLANPGGTHPARPLSWQRYPHLEGFIEPWTSRGRLRPGLRFDGVARGPCTIAEEAVITGIRCQNLRKRLGSDACFPRRPAWRVGDLAACGLEAGGRRFLKWRITGGAALDPALLVPWRRIGDIELGAPKARIDREYGPYHVIQRYGDRIEGSYAGYSNGGTILVTYYGGRVGEIGFDTPYYRTASGFGVRSRMPRGGRWHGFVFNAWSKETPCSCWVKVGTGPRSLRATAANFQKPWFFIHTYRGRVTRFYFASRFVD